MSRSQIIWYSTDVDALLATTLEDGKTVAEFVTEHVATIGENLKVRRFARVAADNGFITSYTHMGGKIVVLVEVEAVEMGFMSNYDEDMFLTSRGIGQIYEKKLLENILKVADKASKSDASQRHRDAGEVAADLARLGWTDKIVTPAAAAVTLSVDPL